MGDEYAKTHQGLGPAGEDLRLRRLASPTTSTRRKEDAARSAHNSKEEAYYFPEGVDLGPHPETFFGVHPYIVEQGKQDLLLPYLVEWKDDLILRHSRAYLIGAGRRLPPARRVGCTPPARR